MEIIRSQDFTVDKSSYVVVKNFKNKIVVESLSNKQDIDFIKLNKNEYLCKSTGEVFECNHKSTRLYNINSVYKSINKIKELIDYNFYDKKKILFITLTYKENMTNFKNVSKDFEVFYKRLKRWFVDIYNFSYMYVVEPQKRGAWHIHLLLRNNNNNNLFIANSIIEALWEKGFTKTQDLKNINDLSLYLSTYLTNFSEDGGKTSKKYERLYMYPTGIHIYRKSNDIVFPDSVICNINELDLSNYNMVYRNKIVLINNGEIINSKFTITYNKT